MKLEPACTEDACRASGEQLDWQMAVDGLSAEQMRLIFAGRSERVAWCDRPREIHIDILPAGGRSDQAESVTHDFTDGRTLLASGQPGRIEVTARNQHPEYLLPQSLNLLLAQQWARTGHMALHAAAIAAPEGGILLLGPRGSGKSILTRAALAAGLPVISDDWVLLGPDASGCRVERLRQFLMLRHGWASERLQAFDTSLDFQPSAKRPKSVLAIPPDDPRFPTSTRIKKIWLLQRPRGARNQTTTQQPANPTTALTRLIEAGMPLLFTRQFPHEHQALLNTLRRLLAGATVATVEPGTDIVEEPGKVFGMN